MDDACRAQHAVDAPSTIVGTRYMDLVNKPTAYSAAFATQAMPLLCRIFSSTLWS